MSDALALLLNQLRSDIYNDQTFRYNLSSVELPNSKRNVAASFNSLMNHLREMMQGYENEEVQGLFKEMEEVQGLFKEMEILAGTIGRLADSRMDMILEICEKLCGIRYSSNVEGEEIVVGFDEEVETLLDQLTGISTNQFQVISIAGMAGVGKTTLARKVYTDPLIEYIFDIRAWTCVSQVYLKRDLLLGLVSSFINELTNEIYDMSNEQLGEKLYRLLKGRKYLVVLDDIWDCMAWNDLKIYFPDDKIGSRVFFTSRDIDMSLHIHAARPAHVLRLRNADESWLIFRKKVFRTGICPRRFQMFGMEITRKCEGLPLALVITAGLLKDKWSFSGWIEINSSLRSFMVRDPSQYMDSLALSYNHLPSHLRQCFVFLGVFPEDYDIPATKLIWLWVALGFIPQTGSKIMEDVAEDFLMDLIKRSLLMTARKRSDGQIRACRIHDLLRDLCLRKAEEENSSSHMYRYGHIPVCASSTTIIIKLPRMSVNPPALPAHSGLCSPFELGKVLQEGRSIHSETFKSLRVLDLEYVPISSFPHDVIPLVNLRYLAIQAHEGSPQSLISNLVNLQMLIISSRKNVMVPKTIWNMVNLRHLYLKSGENLIEDKGGCSNVLENLQTLSQVCPQSCQNIFSSTPNLRKLGFCGPLISRLGDLDFPNIGSLQRLQKLKLLNTTPYPETTKSCNPIMFPEKLKNLTLSNIGMDWEEMWSFSLLPNLEVLKLKLNACIGERWETNDAEFRQLKILKLHDLDLKKWVCSSDNFPRLQRLVVHRCLKLNTIPSDLGRILTLDVIEVSGCTKSAYKSALQIQKEQESEGNCFLKVYGNNNRSHISLMSLEQLKKPSCSQDERQS